MTKQKSKMSSSSDTTANFPLSRFSLWKAVCPFESVTWILKKFINKKWIDYEKKNHTDKSVRWPGASVSSYSPVTRTAFRISSLRHLLVFGDKWNRSDSTWWIVIKISDSQTNSNWNAVCLHQFNSMMK